MAGDHNSLGQKLQHGVTAHRDGRFDEAEQAYRDVLEQAPEHFEALYMLGLVFLQRNQFNPAAQFIGNAIAINPDVATSHANFGLALFHLGRFEETIASCDRAIALNPDIANAHQTRARALLALRRSEEALAAFARAALLNPRQAAIWQGHANTLLLLGRAPEALASFDRALLLEPGHVPAHCSRGYTLEKLKRYDEAYQAYDHAFAIKPGEAFLEGARLHAKMHVCDWRDFEDETARLLARVDKGEPVTSPFALISIASSGSQQRHAAEKFAARRRPKTDQPLWRGEHYDHDRIRIAYLSASLIRHPVGILAAGVFENHNRTRFETFALSFTPGDGTPERKRLEAAFDHFLHFEQSDDRGVAEWIRKNEIDIAIDLDGITAGARSEILAHRPAPIQVSYLGYPSTLGTNYIDYIIADPVVIPAQAESDFAEKIARLPETYLPNTKRSPLAAPPLRRDCGLPEQGVVFCCFNNNFKLTPDIFAVWMRMLRAVDGSVLWLREAGNVVRANLSRAAQQHGVDPQRLVYAPHLPTQEEHFARQQAADIFLDTLYYNAHTTASDALWAGVPVVTCLGPAFAGRVGASLMHAVGLGDLVTDSLAGYEAIALKLAQQPDYLAAVKDRLRRNRAVAPLFDTARITRHLEQAYLTMWENRAAPPQSFTVTPETAWSLPV